MDYAAARHNMVENQLRTNGVADPLLVSAFAAIPRELFVPKPLRTCAYVDEDLAVGGGRHLVEPLALARLLRWADIKPTDVVLNIGCATGYASAVISRLAQTVVALECSPEWEGRATQSLTELGIDNVAVVHGALGHGYPTQAPYDVIIFSGAVPELPGNVSRQLGDGGRLVAVLANRSGSTGHGVVVVRKGDVFSQTQPFDAALPVLPGFQSSGQFVL